MPPTKSGGTSAVPYCSNSATGTESTVSIALDEFQKINAVPVPLMRSACARKTVSSPSTLVQALRFTMVWARVRAELRSAERVNSASASPKSCLIVGNASAPPAGPPSAFA